MPKVICLKFPAALCEGLAESANRRGIDVMVRDGVLWVVDLDDVALFPNTYNDLEQVLWEAIDAAVDAGMDEDLIGFPT